MAISIAVSFAKFLRENAFSTSMWAGGYSPDDVNVVCEKMTEWAHEELRIKGEFLVLWGESDGIQFRGDRELGYVDGERAYLLPNPYIEGDSVGFITSMAKIVTGLQSELYDVIVIHRILHNAI